MITKAKLAPYLLPFCLFLLLIACNPSDHSGTTTKFSGKVVNALDVMSEIIASDTMFLLDHTEEDAIELVTNAITREGEYEFVHDRKSMFIYLKPGTSLKLETDYNLFYRSMKFEGETAPHNRYLLRKHLLEQNYPEEKELYFLPVSEFMKRAEEQRVAKLELLQSMKDSINDEAFFMTTRGNLEYEWANQLMNYDHMHKLLTVNQEMPPTDSLDAVLDAIPLEKPELLESYRYINFVFNKITKQVNQQLATKTFPAYMVDYEMLKASLALTNSRISNTQVQDRMEKEFLNHYLNFISTEQRDELTGKYGIVTD